DNTQYRRHGDAPLAGNAATAVAGFALPRYDTGYWDGQNWRRTAARPVTAGAVQSRCGYVGQQWRSAQYGEPGETAHAAGLTVNNPHESHVPIATHSGLRRSQTRPMAYCATTPAW